MLTSDEGCLLVLIIADARGSAEVVADLADWRARRLIHDMWVCYAGSCQGLGTDGPVLPARSLSGLEVPDLLQAAARDAGVHGIRGVFLHDADVAGLDDAYVEDMRHIADTLRRSLPAPVRVDVDSAYLPLEMVNLFAPLDTTPAFPSDPVARMAVPGVLLALEDRSQPGSVSAWLRRGVNYEAHVAAGICTVARAWRHVDTVGINDLFLRKEDHENFPRVRALRHMVRIARAEQSVGEAADAAAVAMRGGELPPLVARRTSPRGQAQDELLLDRAGRAVADAPGDPTGFSPARRGDKDVHLHTLREMPGRIWRFGREQTKETFYTATRMGTTGVIGKGKEVTLGANQYRDVEHNLPADRLAQISAATQQYARATRDRPVVPRSEADGMPLELMSLLRAQAFALVDGGTAPVTDVRRVPVLADRTRSAPDPGSPMVLDADVAVALHLPDDEQPFLDMWRLGGVIHQMHGMLVTAPPADEPVPQIGDVAGRGYAVVQAAPIADIVDRHVLMYEINRCLTKYQGWSASFLGQAAARVAHSLDTAVDTLRATSQELAMPDFPGRLNAARRRFQVTVWTLLLSAVIGTFSLMVWGDNITGPISRMSDIPEDAPLAAGGFLPALVRGFREVYQYSASWILTLWLVLMLIWLLAATRYHRRQLAIDDDIVVFMIERDNQLRAWRTAQDEYMRLAAVNTALSPWAEILAWVIHNPQPAPRDPFGAHEDAAEGGGAGPVLPHAVRVSQFTVSDKFAEVEQRRAIEREIAPGYLHSVFLETLVAAFHAEGFAADEVLRSLEQGEQGHTDLRPILLAKLRGHELDPALRRALEERVRAHRRELVDAGDELDLLSMPVSPHETVRRFLVGVNGPKVVLNNSIWRWDGQAQGAAAGEGGMGVTGEFRSVGWLLPDLCDSRDGLDEVVALDLCLDGDEIQAASVRLDVLQWEPTHRFACFRQQVRPDPFPYPDEVEL